MAIPKIAMIPSSFKAGKLGSVLPLNGDGDFTFTRASSATRINQSGLIEVVATGVPRIDHTGGGCPALLIERQSTNLTLQSQDFDNSSWTKSGSSISPNTAVSPDGTLNSDKLIESTSSGSHVIRESFNPPISSGFNYTISVFAKQNGRSRIRLSNAAQSGVYANFDILNGAIISEGSFATASIKDYGNGWYRCSIYFLSTTTISQTNIRILNSTNQQLYTGDGVSGVFLYGFQLEEGELTSYTPTSSATSTRIADLATLDLTPFTLTSITETIGGVEQSPITTIPTTYTIPNGAINKIIME
jgi:hypothetical protein